MNSVHNVISLRAANTMKINNQLAQESQEPVSASQDGVNAPSFRASSIAKMINTPQVRKGGVALTMAALAMLGASCTKGVGCMSANNGITTDLAGNVIDPSDCDYIVPSSNVNISVSNTNSVVVNASNQELAALLEAIDARDAARWAQMLDSIAENNRLQASNNAFLGQIIQLLIRQGGKLDEIIDMMGAGFNNLAGQNEDLRAVLADIRAAVGETRDLSQEQNALLAALVNNVIAIANSTNNIEALTGQEIDLMRYLNIKKAMLLY